MQQRNSIQSVSESSKLYDNNETSTTMTESSILTAPSLSRAYSNDEIEQNFNLIQNMKNNNITNENTNKNMNNSSNDSNDFKDSNESKQSSIDAHNSHPYQKILDEEMKLRDDQIKQNVLDNESQLLLNYKCVVKIGENGINAIFNPSPHLYDENGNIKEEKKDYDDYYGGGGGHSRKHSRKHSKRLSMLLAAEEDEYMANEVDLNKASSMVAASMQCDSVEASFFDHHNEEYKDIKLLQNNFTIHNGFIQACELAWSKHYPLKIEPNHIWLLILQAVALHVDKYSQQLRDKWVKFEGKKKLVVIRDNFVKGLRHHNDWSEVVKEFCEQIDSNTVEGSVDLLDADFSNATYVDKIAAKITIMDICKNYFEYIVRTRCGFPQITLTGTKNDWINLYNKTNILLNTKVDQQFGQKWKKSLMPVLARFVGVFDGKIDCLFWNSMIKRGARRGSGGWEWYSGWINIFFPIIQDKENQFCEPYSNNVSYIESGLRKAGRGNDVNNYPNGLASAPVKWEYYNLNFKLKFISGFLGVLQDKNTNELTPMIGWVIGEQTKDNEQANQTYEQTMIQNK